MDLRVIM